ncbi:MAG: polymer-forming cytoskeletal protein [Anaerolineae bacterium]|nr:polymer-forming cytoskeletal protein [Anaerolineae bacterium]
MKTKKIWLISALVVVLLVTGLFTVAVPVQAAEVIGGDENHPHVVINEPVDDDLIVTAGKITVNAPISGNLIASGTEVTLNSVVEGDVLAGGQTVKISEDAVIEGNLFFGATEIIVQGQIGGSVFGGAGTILFDNSASVGRNVFVGGYNLEVNAGAVIARDLFGGFYQIDLSGQVMEDALLSAEAVEFKGDIAGNLTLEISDPNPHMGMPTTIAFPGLENPPRTMEAGLEVGENASLGGELKLITPILVEPKYDNIEESVVTLEAPLDETPEGKGQEETHKGAGSLVFRWMRRNAGRFISLCVVGALLLWLCRKPFEETVDFLKNETWKSLGYGALAYFGGYLAFFLGAVAIGLVAAFLWVFTLGILSPVVASLGFSALSLVFAAFTLAVKFISKLVIIYWLGRAILKPLAEEKPGRAWLAALIGIAIYAVARALPVLGWFLGSTATLFGMGAIILWCVSWWQEHHPVKKPEALPDEESQPEAEEYPLPAAD